MSGDVNLNTNCIPLIPLVILLEAIIFLAFTGSEYINFLKMLFLIILVNIVTSLVLPLIPAELEFINKIIYMSGFFVFAVLIEFTICFSLISGKIKKSQLFKITAIQNLVSTFALSLSAFFN